MALCRYDIKGKSCFAFPNILFNGHWIEKKLPESASRQEYYYGLYQDTVAGTVPLLLGYF